MKIFIMIAVILIASSFLLKAFNIDILGFLKEKLGAPVPKAGKVLHVKIDPNQRSRDVEVWEFHLTDNTTHLSEIDGSDQYYFYISKRDIDGACLLFTTDETGDGRDEGYVYYISPGAIIQDGCQNIASCVSGKIDPKSGCTTLIKARDRACGDENCREVFGGPGVSCEGTNNYVNCGEIGPTDTDFFYALPLCEGVNRDNVTDQNFCEGVDCFWHSYCRDHPSECNLLVAEKYKIRYGLICSDEKIWVPCTKEAADKTTIISGKTCNWANEIGTWQ